MSKLIAASPTIPTSSQVRVGSINMLTALLMRWRMFPPGAVFRSARHQVDFLVARGLPKAENSAAMEAI